MSREAISSTYADVTNAILDLDRENLTVTVNGSVNFLEFQQYLAQERFLFPLDNLNSHQTSLSYNVVNGIPSVAQGKYGTFREYVVGLEGVLNNGTQVKLGGKNIKNVSGFDLMGLLVNSKEKLGVISQLTLRLLPLPEARFLLITPFDSLNSAFLAANKLFSHGGQPAKIQVFNSAFSHTLGLDLPSKSALIVAEFDGFIPSLNRQINLYKDIVAQYTKKSFFEFGNENDIQQFWEKLRHSGGPLVGSSSGNLTFSSYLNKMHQLAIDLESYIDKSSISLALLLNPSTGLGHLVSIDSPKDNKDWFLEAERIINNHDGLIPSDDFTSPELNIIRDSILAIFNNDDSNTKKVVRGGY